MPSSKVIGGLGGGGDGGGDGGGLGGGDGGGDGLTYTALSGQSLFCSPCMSPGKLVGM